MKRFWREPWFPLVAVLALTLFCGLLPFAVYVPDRLSGRLPSEDLWRQHGGNHGPWWGESREILVTISLLALVVMPILTIVVASVTGPKRKSARWVLAGVGLWALQWTLVVLQINILSWTID